MAVPPVLAANLHLDVRVVPEQQVSPTGARKNLTEYQQGVSLRIIELVIILLFSYFLMINPCQIKLTHSDTSLRVYV